MKQWIVRIWRLRIWMDTQGQDLVEYALLAGFVAVAAGAVIPNVSSSMSNIYSKLASRLLQASGA
ncbi:MAG TPA: Flp family type IVb pilin [Bryobacterales bacterium]|nr:Flp family type IVb pilin [Bryobacterales bacterium]